MRFSMEGTVYKLQGALLIVLLVALTGCQKWSRPGPTLLTISPTRPATLATAVSVPTRTVVPPRDFAGLTRLRRNDRFEYVDTEGRRVAYWDVKDGRLRILSAVLSDKDNGLLHGIPAAQVARLLPSRLENAMQVRFPLPFNPRHAPFRVTAFQEGEWRLLGFRVPVGTPFVALLPGQVTRGYSPAVELKRVNITNSTHRFSLGFAFTDAEYVIPAEPVETHLGDLLFRTTTTTSPIPVHRGQYLVTLSGGSPAGPFSIGWENLLRDDVGRVIYLSDAP